MWELAGKGLFVDKPVAPFLSSLSVSSLHNRDKNTHHKDLAGGGVQKLLASAGHLVGPQRV